MKDRDAESVDDTPSSPTTSASTISRRLSFPRGFRMLRRLSQDFKDDAHLSESLDKNNRKDFKERQKRVGNKLLLLGSGDSGKTTLLKQMRILHGNGFTAEEIKDWKEIIQDNIITATKLLIQAVKDNGESFKIENENLVGKVTETVARGRWVLSELKEDIYNLWQDEAIQLAYAKRNEWAIMIPENILYFIKHLDRISESTYQPSNEDILKARYRTTKVSEFIFHASGNTFCLIDVGGQQEFRPTWSAFFDDCKAIIFVTSITSYDQVLEEDKKTNRFKDALALFAQVCNNPLLQKVAIILFLNKCDLLAEKLAKESVKRYFPEFPANNNPQDVKDVSSFLKRQVLKQNHDEKRTIFSHSTTSTDTLLMKNVISDTMQNFCELYDQSPDRNRRLFLAICQQLSHMGLIHSDDFLDELSGVRSTYKRVFRELVLEAVSSIQQQPPAKWITHTDTLWLNQSDDHVSESNMTSLLIPSRYKDDFLPLNLLGKGGFGTVWKCKNKLDQMDYAIKKIFIKKWKQVDKVLREVKFQARLNHSNVVRYYSAWLEHQDPIPSSSSSSHVDDSLLSDSEESSHSRKIVTLSSDAQLESPDAILFESGIEMDRCSSSSSYEHSVLPESNPHAQLSVQEQLSQLMLMDQKHPHLSSPTQHLVLHIQMELCDFSLEEWIQCRDHHCATLDQVNEAEVLKIFKDIVTGLAYVHANNCIHRDIKPKNIYWKCDKQAHPCDNPMEAVRWGWDHSGRWLVGDFGLVTAKEVAMDLEPSDIHLTQDERTMGIGTLTYAAPEQVSPTERVYSDKADIYSLGIILYELLHPFQTAMERIKCITDVRQGIFPREFLVKWPKEATLILWLMSENPLDRPSATDLIQFELLNPVQLPPLPNTPTLLEPHIERIQELERENSLLKQRIAELELLVQQK